MKLNPDCVRDTLLYLEENLTYVDNNDYGLEYKTIVPETIASELHKKHNYNKDDVNYSVEKLLEIGFITASTQSRGNNNSLIYAPISDITWAGHQFLNTIRSKTVWEATK